MVEHRRHNIDLEKGNFESVVNSTYTQLGDSLKESQNLPNIDEILDQPFEDLSNFKEYTLQRDCLEGTLEVKAQNIIDNSNKISKHLKGIEDFA